MASLLLVFSSQLGVCSRAWRGNLFTILNTIENAIDCEWLCLKFGSKQEREPMLMMLMSASQHSCLCGRDLTDFIIWAAVVEDYQL